MKDEVEAQVAITKGFGQQAVPAAASYADKQAVNLRREGKEDEARQWDEGGEYRVGLHAVIGALTGGVPGAVGAGTGAAVVPIVGEAIADLNLPEPVRQALTQVAGMGVGVVGGSAAAAASLNQTAHNYVPHSPYDNVRVRVSKENARLTQQCEPSCTVEDFRRIDAAMQKLESAATIAENAKRGGLTLDRAMTLAQLAVDLAPFYGSGESLAQLISGQSSITGEEVNRFWAAVGVVPLAGGALKRVGEPAVGGLAAVLKGGTDQAAMLKAQLVGQAVARGHAFEKHVLEQGEFSTLGIRTREQFAVHIENVVKNPSEVRYYKDGRTVYLQESTGTVVVRNSSSGESTAFRPKDWVNYTSTLPRRTSPY